MSWLSLGLSRNSGVVGEVNSFLLLDFLRLNLVGSESKQILELLDVIVGALFLCVHFHVKAKMVHISLPWLSRWTLTAKWIALSSSIVVGSVMVWILIANSTVAAEWISTHWVLHGVELVLRSSLRGHLLGVSLDVCKLLVEHTNNIIWVSLWHLRLILLCLLLLLLLSIHLHLLLDTLLHSHLHLLHHWIRSSHLTHHWIGHHWVLSGHWLTSTHHHG